MGGATKIFTLLTTPLPLHNRPSLLRLAFSFRISNALFSPRHFTSLPPSPSPSHHQGFCRIRALRRCLHTQYALRDDRFGDPNAQRAPHTWPEWSRLINGLASCGYFHRNDAAAEDAFASVDGLPEEFLRAARSCLAFARDRPDVLRLLSRKDVEIVTENGAPFLFKNSDESAWRMRSFLSSGQSNVLASDVAHTLDLMRFLLSYMSKPTVSLEGGAAYNNDFVGSSVRHLLDELSQVIHTVPGSNGSASLSRPYPGKTSRPQEQNIEMKRGDWICPRCNFMNFARNMKCLECEEARPKRQLTSGEWECPQCDFYNYSRNVVCLRCDCKRPGENLFSSSSTFGCGNNRKFNKGDSGISSAEYREERWLKKASSIDSTNDMNSVIADNDFPGIMPMRKGENRFVFSTRKTPLERRLANSHNQCNLGHDQNQEGSDCQPANNNIDATFSTRLDKLLGRTSAHSETHNNRSNSDAGMPPVTGPSSQQFGRPQGNNSSYVPFVPLPPDLFAKNPQSFHMQEHGNVVTNNYENVGPKADMKNYVSGSKDYGRWGESFPYDTQGSRTVPAERGNEQIEKPQSWFQKVAELHDEKGLASGTSNDGLPEVSTFRGEDHIVVGKKRDHSLSSPLTRRYPTPEQENTPKYVPFPPNYFANAKPPADQTDRGVKESFKISNTSFLENPPKSFEAGNPGVFNRNQQQWGETERTSAGTWSMGSSEGHSIPQSYNRESTADFDKVNTADAPCTLGSSPGPSKIANARETWAGKSLEGSAVKEADPLDMSEEAKTERWYRRVAQIKHISELSEIPDEDFPSIMPMRKGVNRFVVSKRKTPLERRLTSAQYRRNLPIVNSEPVKKENDN